MQKAKHPNHAKLSGQHFLAQIRYNFSRMDWWILLIVGLLSVYSLIMVYSSTQYLLENGATVPTPLHYLSRQMFGIGLGLAVSAVAICLPYRLYIEPFWLFVANGLIAFLILLTRFIGVSGGGARSWLSFMGLNFQPGELAKIGLILLMGILCVKSRREVLLTKERWFANMDYESVISIGLMLLDLVLIFAQPDMGMFMIISATLLLVALALIMNSKTQKVVLLILAGLGIGLITWIYTNADKLATSDHYQLRRFGSFVNPFKYAKAAGYQLVNAYIAISRGGLFGRGIGHSLTKQEGLPAGHTDYILAVIGEESGLVGLVVVVLLLSALIFLCFRWAAKSQDTFRRAVFTGVGCLLLVQSSLNIGGVSGLVPLTGVTLPFVSYGGTSMVLTMMLVGVLQVMIIEEKRVLEAQVSPVKEDYHGI